MISIGGGWLYFATVLILAGADLVAAWGFDLQYGTTRVLNLSFLASQAAGAYTAAMLTIGPPVKGLGLEYAFGATLPWPIAWAAGSAAGGLVSLVLGMIVAPRLKDVYFAIVTLVVSVGALNFVSAYGPLFNGDQGLSGVPTPITNSIISSATSTGVMLGLTSALVALCWFGLRRVHKAPISRRLRAIRDNEITADTVGISPLRIKLLVMTAGGALGGLSGVVLVSAYGAWGTGSWQVTELVAILTAVVIGGSGNLLGVTVGVFLVFVGIGQGVTFLPGLSGNGELGSNLQAAVISLLSIGFFWLRPSGLVSERIRKVRDLPRSGGVLANVPVGSSLGPHRLDRDGRFTYPALSTTAPGMTALRDDAGAHGRTILRVEELEMSFGSIVAVRDCSFSIGGGVTFMVGPNGAGKSSVAAAIAGTVRPRSGRVLFDGAILTGPAHSRVAKGIVRTFQLPQEFGTMTVLENVMVALPGRAGTGLGSAIFGMKHWMSEERESVEEAAEILDMLGLMPMANEQAHTLSGGQKKLLEFARALACRPKLLVLDEPTAGVSPVLYKQITDFLIHLRGLDVAMLIISHEMSLVNAIADEVVVMASGQVLVQGTFEDIRRNDVVQDAYLGRR